MPVEKLTGDTSAVPQPRFLRFSLGGLLIASVLVATIASHAYTSWKLKQVTAENRLLKQEINRFQVEDESKLHVAALHSPDRLTWRWRTFIPSDRKFVLRVESGNLPESGLPTSLGWVGDELPPGELFITVTAHKERDGRWTIITMTPNVKTRYPVQSADSAPFENADFTIRQLGRDGIETIPRGEVAVLLRARKSKAVGGGYTVDMQPTSGVMAWIEDRQLESSPSPKRGFKRKAK